MSSEFQLSNLHSSRERVLSFSTVIAKNAIKLYNHGYFFWLRVRQTGVTAGHRGDPFARDVMTRLSNLEPLWLPIHSYHGVLIHEFRMLRISLLCSRASKKTRNLTGKYLASSIRPTSASPYLSNSSRDPLLRDPLLQEIQTNWPHLPPPVLLGLQLQHYPPICHPGRLRNGDGKYLLQF